MRKRVAIVIAGVVTGVVVAYFMRSTPSDKSDESAATTAAPAAPQQTGSPAADNKAAAATTGTLRVATWPPTAGERPDTICDELSNRRMAREQATRDAEPKDPAWAYPMEQKLREVVSPRLQTKQIEVISIDCKTTFCELRAQALGPETNEGFNRVMEGVREQPWNDFTGLAITNDTDSGNRLHYARVSRRQSSQTAREEVDDMQRAVLQAEEQALAACTAQQVERQQRELDARNAEPRDSSWADPMEQLLRQHITAQLVRRPFEHMEIVCRSTFCEIKATGKTTEAYLAFQKVSQEAAAEPWSDMWVTQSGGGAYGEDWHQEVTLTRRGAMR